MQFSTPKQDADVKVLPRRGVRRSMRLSGGEVQNVESSTNGTRQRQEAPDADGVDTVGESTVVGDPSKTDMDVSKGSTKIALPFSDTPVINRNKELRRATAGRRRSSLGLRGRRASSLIDNGQTAIPHHQVQTSQFYKHIEAEGLSEPRRMKQLLTWCGERALGPKPGHSKGDNSVIMSGKEPFSSLLLLQLTIS